MSLITIEDLKAELPIRAGNTDYDTKLTAIAEAVSTMIETSCRRTFDVETYEQICHVQVGGSVRLDLSSDWPDGIRFVPSSQPFRLTNLPLVADTDVQVFYDLGHQFAADTQLEADEVVVLREKGLVYVSRYMQISRDSVKLVYDAGYETIPAEVKLAATMQGVHLFNKSTAENVGAMASDDAGGSPKPYAVLGGLLPDVTAMIAPYRKLLRGRG